ncbi:MAG: succinate dehydrogenase, hydrophobic membrane anchor protein [Rhodocyclaceae bacterium]|jgi:succinate dehydrogenase / fumarate reductase membrane anchor subunit|nr:succinate dehydrogenase, hydrophobic membrane anchor protein [Rhodocyclaceae bacterium]MDO9601227.1 succinate dehydrogenase, hydrophobic membrane anchor protein [Rhodocyclaceae bacterium]MDP2108715.1 succinate dehydrogenase, hydrophobic membrane anchor protein [Rhodocyclaceae bacterium]MDP2194731.1 succinate dehydrogenase, hydrophobic membrane anchor protein [Rhodocyclaceae bacterium]MDP3036178.1 succinate dehydrogenase, hydrophobic membrane anchor protein [Rhodocyclaceae bacterium]
MVNRKLVGAHYGLMDWLVQRVTGVVMAAYTVVVAFALYTGAGSSYERWVAFMSATPMRFISFLCVVSLCWHAWIGVRDTWMDYVQPAGIKLTLHVLTVLSVIGCGGWAVQILWRL